MPAASLKRIQAGQLRPGMHVHKLCGPWLEHPFWRNSFDLTDPKDIDRILGSNVTEVWIDTARGLDIDDGMHPREGGGEDGTSDSGAPEAITADAPAAKRVPMRDELARAVKICARSSHAVAEMFQEARLGRAVDPEKADSLVVEISASVLRNPGALISVARLKTADNYTYMHSVAVCALMIALARQLDLSESDTREAGLGGLLHDVGKMTVPPEILNKPGRLTTEEFARVQEHSAAGHRMLSEGGGVSDIALDVCLHHHEKIDGTGYPERLTGDRISLFAKMGAVCDVYDAVTSDRPYKKGWDPADALRRMAEWQRGHFEEAVFGAFVKSVGIYPVGSLVRLHSGRLAVIVEQDDASLVAPKVKVFFSTKSQVRIAPEVIELARPGVRDRIVSREDPDHWGFKDLADLWQGAAPA